jgi:glycosyltransferase involved in cell wall biosynthesis
MFARGLARLPGQQVSFVVRGPVRGLPDRQDGVRLFARPDRLYALYEAVGQCLEKSPGFPGVRLRRWEWPLLWRLPTLAACRLGVRRRDPRQADRWLSRLDVDLYCTFGVQSDSARVIASAHARGRKAVLLIGSDGDLDERYTANSEFVSPYGDMGAVCHWIITHADAIVAQTAAQQQLLQTRFGRDASVLANPIDLAVWDARVGVPLPAEVTAGLDRYVLWVGRAERIHKRPQVLLELARQCPEVDFLMVLNPRQPDVERQIHRDRPENVRIVACVPGELMPAVFGRAAALVSTSSLEGFPNTFLQAAASGVPIMSLTVGREFLRDSHSGFHAAGDLERLAEAVREVWQSSVASRGTRHLARRFVETHHDLPSQSARLARLLRDTAR